MTLFRRFPRKLFAKMKKGIIVSTLDHHWPCFVLNDKILFVVGNNCLLQLFKQRPGNDNHGFTLFIKITSPLDRGTETISLNCLSVPTCHQSRPNRSNRIQAKNDVTVYSVLRDLHFNGIRRLFCGFFLLSSNALTDGLEY